MIRGLATAMLMLLTVWPAQAADCVVILMHGKWGGPKSPHLKVLSEKIEPVCRVEMRNMPWSRLRNYDQTYQDALDDLALAVAQYRQTGSKTVILAGHSFGANAALAYQAAIGDADAVVALAPGHSPANMYQSGLSVRAVDEAKSQIAAGNPGAKVAMTDLNQGERKEFELRADILSSYFDPTGLGHMPGTVARFKRPTPFLWVIGTQDPLFRQGQAYAFDRAPNTPLNQYIVVEAGHAATPEVAAGQVVEWIEAVAAR